MSSPEVSDKVNGSKEKSSVESANSQVSWVKRRLEVDVSLVLTAQII